MTRKEELLRELSVNTYVMLKPSQVEGIGVFALRDIPKGCRDMFSKSDPDEAWVTVTKEEVETLPDYARFLIGNYCLYDTANYYIPEHGFKKMDLSLFLNHSNSPNIISINEGDQFEALCNINAGAELLIDYGTIVTDDT